MLLDTSGLLSYFDDDDARHEDADTFFHAASARLTHAYVLAEFVPLCRKRRLNVETGLSFVVDLLNTPAVEIVWVEEWLHRAAITLLQERPDKTYSLCDAVSFLLMRTRRLTEALTTDRHFEQEGFVRLLKP
jgi:uncharacterized protein